MMMSKTQLRDLLPILYSTFSTFLGAVIGFLLGEVKNANEVTKTPYLWALYLCIIILVLLGIFIFYSSKRKRIDSIKECEIEHSQEIQKINEWCLTCKEEGGFISQGRYFLLNENDHHYQKIILNPKIEGVRLILKSELDFTPAVNRILNKICKTYTDNLPDKDKKLQSELRFTASYQIVTEENNQEVLKYCGFSTLDGVPPKSMTMNKTYTKGDRLSGFAWERQETIIEDEFHDYPSNDYKGFIPNYEGQAKKYNSMICIPIYSFKERNNYNIVGILTLCSYINKYFGNKGDENKAKAHSYKIQPFTHYLSILTDIYNTYREQTTIVTK